MGKKLLDQVRDQIRVRHYSIKTEKSYVGWIKRYIYYHKLRHPAEMGKREIEQFLTHLAVERNVSPTTQNQAFNALLFLYEHVLGISMKGQNIQALRAAQKKRIPTVLTREETQSVISHLSGVYQLIVSLMYGCGLRMNEALRLRVKDIDFGYDRVYLYDTKSQKDRVLPLPQRLKEQLKTQVAFVKELHEGDVKAGFGTVEMPHSLAKKIPQCRQGTALAVSVSDEKDLDRSPQRYPAPPSCSGDDIEQEHQTGGRKGRHSKEGEFTRV